MFTVILLSDSAKQLFAPVRVYFEPFVESGAIAFCDWNQALRARDLREAVPELPSLIRGKKSWRAVVVDHPNWPLEEHEVDERERENPFDFLDNTNPSLNLSDSKHALIRLSHILLGYPQMSSKTFRPYLQFEDAETGEPRAGNPRELLIDFCRQSEVSVEFDFDSIPPDDDAWFGIATPVLAQKHNNVRRLFAEVEYSDAEHRTHEELSERYRMKEVRPSEVIFIATRAVREEDEKDQLKRAWQTNVEQNSSRFVERNDYPPMSRFAVYDLLEPENSGYEQDLLRFWLGVLTISRNMLPPGGFQADRVYQLGVEFGVSELGDMLNSHISRLAMMRDHLDHLIAVRPRPPQIEVSELLAPVETDVDFDSLGGEELEASSTGYGLASDKPRDEHRRWSEEVLRVSAAATLFMRKPRRMVARAVHSARELLHRSNREPVALDEFERDDLEEQLAKRLRPLVVPTTTELLDHRRMQRTIDTGDSHVRELIRQRMQFRTITFSVAVVLGIWFAAFLPYLIQAGRQGGVAIVEAICVTLLVIGVAAGCCLLTLFVLRRWLLSRILGFNHGVRFEVASVRSGAAHFADYLSLFVTYRRGAQELRNSLRADEIRLARLERLKSLQSRVIRQIQEEKGIVHSIGVPLQVHRTSQGMLDFDVDDPATERMLFRFPEGDAMIPFNDSGEYIVAPYDFVRRLSLSRLPVFERKQSVGSEAQTR